MLYMDAIYSISRHPNHGEMMRGTEQDRDSLKHRKIFVHRARRASSELGIEICEQAGMAGREKCTSIAGRGNAPVLRVTCAHSYPLLSSQIFPRYFRTTHFMRCAIFHPATSTVRIRPCTITARHPAKLLSHRTEFTRIQ